MGKIYLRMGTVWFD